MIAERTHPIQQDPLVAELAAMVEAVASIAPETQDDTLRRLAESEARCKALWQRLNDANCMAINIAAALNLLSAEGSIGREEVPDYVTGTIWLCQGAMNKLAEHLQAAV
ncbi:hypothetical protein RM61_07200 [Xanthomonas phaseoli pv. phaseoli]|uniref:hypothetical protein n=1 Tax=Xanthomonas phaseoli TaxID=1985254 RepID=UPI000574CD30|nr:hypothetical protein [Xanthomonas phaseoli]KHS08005.1 hypothetical protein RM61_07200 [Xanthomonas phaseoli pv. phaseoli]